MLLKQLSANPNYRSATLIFIGLFAWMLSGLFTSNATETPENTAPSHYKVRTKIITASPYQHNYRLSGKTQENRKINLRAEVSGQVVELPAEKGSLVKAGDIICRLATEDRALRVSQAQARLKQARLEYDAALRLKDNGFQSRTVIANKEAELETAKADLHRVQLNLEKTQIRAPFAGVIDKQPVEIGQLVQRGDSCATLLDLDPLLVVSELASRHINTINLRDNVRLSLITGEQLDGKVQFISKDANNITRTFHLEVATPNPQHRLESGITASLNYSTDTIQAHQVSPSLLSLDDQGYLGLRILDGDSRVRFVRVTLLKDDIHGVWVSGLPATTQLITVGQEYVSEGQRVIAIDDDPYAFPADNTTSAQE